MSEESLIANIFGWSGTCLALFFFLSPGNLFLKMQKTGETKHIPYLMLVFNTFNTALWVIYGLSGGGTQPWVCNSIGLAFTMVYCIWYLLFKFSSFFGKISTIISYLIVVGGIVFFAILCHINEDEWGKKVKDPVGYFAMAINTIMYAAPGQNLVSFFIFYKV